CGDFGGHGFMNADENPERIRRSKAILDLALDLECTVVTTHIGVVPTDKSNPRYSIMQKACYELGKYGDEIGASFAIETGPETAAVLKEFIDSLGVSGVRVNLDPANLAMVCGDDSAEAARILGPYAVHTHAKDGIMLVKENPEVIYGLIKHDELEKIQYFREVVLGTGSVDFDKYLPALAAAGYDGFLTVEREVGETPEKDIAIAVEFLKEKLAKYQLA
ncbi:MAG: sugar phosphate isomerase/epimerase, partial [Clostridia bacterium]|nr:sugar phosphate isomerase/epimerase [Clostridia bacterium]